MKPRIGHTLHAEVLIATLMLLLASASAVFAQAKPRPRRPPPPPPSRAVEIGGYAMLGVMNFTAADSFDVILGSPSGAILGGGGRIGLPWRMMFGGPVVDVGAWRFTGDGERVFVFQGQEFGLNIPVEIGITAFELSGGWQFRIPRLLQLRPYVTGGYSSYGYKETSDNAAAGEDVDERFSGFHLAGGAEYKITRWLGVAGELNWTTIPGAIGAAGVAAEFDETDLGGTSFRFKLTIGR
jgi:opacity protein-like surface antigen